MPAFSRGEEPFPAASAWRGDARELLARAIHRHGGWSRWKALAGLALFPSVLRGLVPATKGLGRTFPLPPRIDVWPREAVVVFRDYPAAGERGVFSAGGVALVDARGVAIVADEAHRRTFDGWRKYRRWSPLDALYFFAYALTHYLGLPFTLVDGEPVRLRRATAGGRDLRGVEVRLPRELHTHCRAQTFYFDDEGLLRRHDYVAEVLGRWARGAHLWERFVELDGLPVALRRHVVARLGARTLPAVALHAELEVAVVDGPAPAR